MIKLLKNFTKKEWILSIFVLLLVLLQVGLELKMPDYMSTITKLVQTEGSKMSDILINGLYMTLCAFGSMFGAIITGYLTSTISANFSRNTRKKVFSKVESFSMKEIKKFSTNSLITRTTNDITQIQMLLAGGLMLIIRVPITVVWAITKILNKNWQWSLITGIAVFALLTMVTIIGIIVIPRFKIIQKLIDKINGVTRENLNGIRVVRAFNAEKYQEDKFENVNSELADKQLTIQRTFCIFDPVMFLVMYGLTLGIYFVGAKLIQEANMMDKIALFGDMVVFSSYAMQVIISFLMLAMIFMMLPRAQVSANRIREILDEEISIKDGSFDGNTEEKGTIIFKDVSFKYPDAEECLLDNISFEINKGETVAFIGSTGSGKSTLINLIPRFYDVTSGEVLVDGVNVKEYKQEKLFNKIGYVSQKAILFNGTISENVDYGTNGKEKISKKEIEEAIEIAQAKEFVEKMENTYDGYVAQGGTNLSGGQKQRISIARAIARDPEFLIFDDSFSALDYKTDSVLRKQLKEKLNGITCVIVAQRIGTIINADKIIVLDEGKIVGIGKHKELLKNCNVYKQIAKSQLSEEELENE